MAISDRINEMYTHVGNVYDTITNVDLPTNKNIQNIPSTMRSSYLEIMNNGIDTIWNNWEKVTGEGEALTLNSTEEAPMKINLKGNTSQETTTGKNLLPRLVKGTTEFNGKTYSVDDDGVLTMSGTPSSSGAVNIQFQTPYQITSETRYIYLLNDYADGTFGVRIMNGNTRIFEIIPNPENKIVDLSQYSGQTITNIQIYQNLSFTATRKIYLMICTNNSQTTFEPYTNGASPNPNYPQDIHVVSGDNYINVCGKNLFDKDSISNGFLDESGIVGGDTSAYRTSDFIPILPNTAYYKTTTSSPRTKYYNKNKQPLNTTTYWDISIGGNAGTFTTPSNAYYFRFSYPVAGVNANDIMINKGTTALPYEPYQGASYPINLGNIELCKIGDYQDYIYKNSGTWYLHKKIEKVVFDGSESWAINTSYTYNVFYRTLDNYARISNTQTTYCEYYKGIENAGGIADFGNNYNNSIGVRTANDNIKDIYISNNSITSASDFKTWLSTHNTIVYYVLNTPTYTEITDTTLQQQLNALEKARSYNSQTNLTQTNDDKPFILDVTALKELTQ